MSIEIKNLSKRFGTKQVLQNVTLCAEGPLVLMGPSGCGKTTLLRILMGLEAADSGSVRMAGREAGGARVAAVFQEDRLCPQLTAAANICLTAGGNPSPVEQAARRELCSLGFTGKELALPAGRLSGGQKRRAALLRALLCPGAEVLLLDEPFTGMDAELVRAAAAAVARLAAGRDCILVTHDEAVPGLLGWPVLRMVPPDLPKTES